MTVLHPPPAPPHHCCSHKEPRHSKVDTRKITGWSLDCKMGNYQKHLHLFLLWYSFGLTSTFSSTSTLLVLDRGQIRIFLQTLPQMEFPISKVSLLTWREGGRIFTPREESRKAQEWHTPMFAQCNIFIQFTNCKESAASQGWKAIIQRFGHLQGKNNW